MDANFPSDRREKFPSSRKRRQRQKASYFVSHKSEKGKTFFEKLFFRMLKVENKTRHMQWAEYAKNRKCFAISFLNFFISLSDWRNVERFVGGMKKLAHLIIRNCSSTLFVCKFQKKKTERRVEWMALLAEMTLFNFFSVISCKRWKWIFLRFSLSSSASLSCFLRALFCCRRNSLIQKMGEIKKDSQFCTQLTHQHSSEQKLFHFTELYSFQFTFYNFSCLTNIFWRFSFTFKHCTRHEDVTLCTG